MSEKRNESLESCSCSIFTTGYGSSAHYIICARCAGRGYPEGRVIDGACDDPMHPGRRLYRSSMTRRERLNREREDLINTVQVHTDILGMESSLEGSFLEAEEKFHAFLRESIGVNVRKIREISRKIGPVRPVITNNKKHYD